MQKKKITGNIWNFLYVIYNWSWNQSTCNLLNSCSEISVIYINFRAIEITEVFQQGYCFNSSAHATCQVHHWTTSASYQQIILSKCKICMGLPLVSDSSS